MNFLAIDVETANESYDSICQVGIATFSNGVYQSGWSQLVDPEDDFLPFNTEIHGIDEDSVRGAPRFDQIHGEIARRAEGQIVVSHSAFDRVSISRACLRDGLPMPPCDWLDSAKAVRRAFTPDFGRSGYGLKNVAAHFGISFSHHDALEDARCAGEIMLRCLASGDMSISDWLLRCKRPISGFADGKVKLAPVAEGYLSGEIVVFTGALEIPRREAAEMAARVGAEVNPGVTKHTTLLVVGNQDARKLHGQEISSKHAKARQLAASGQAIRIISEADFSHLLTL